MLDIKKEKEKKSSNKHASLQNFWNACIYYQENDWVHYKYFELIIMSVAIS